MLEKRTAHGAGFPYSQSNDQNLILVVRQGVTQSAPISDAITQRAEMESRTWKITLSTIERAYSLRIAHACPRPNYITADARGMRVAACMNGRHLQAELSTESAEM